MIKNREQIADELKPCPFCGKKALLIPLEHYREWFVACSSRYCVEQKHAYKSKRAAIKAWNKRVTDSIRGTESE